MIHDQLNLLTKTTNLRNLFDDRPPMEGLDSLARLQQLRLWLDRLYDLLQERERELQKQELELQEQERELQERLRELLQLLQRRGRPQPRELRELQELRWRELQPLRALRQLRELQQLVGQLCDAVASNNG